ncbi:hypothetical protein [Bradyrhizobium sp. STM 3562]|uniref:hypothetical protein n=1 Tax=Bradyrhizobium sp. STM 3562 TaxID=578924 RepID=UPI00388EA5ED
MKAASPFLKSEPRLSFVPMASNAAAVTVKNFAARAALRRTDEGCNGTRSVRSVIGPASAGHGLGFSQRELIRSVPTRRTAYTAKAGDDAA